MPSLPTPAEMLGRLDARSGLDITERVKLLTDWQSAIARQAQEEALAMGDKALKLALDNCGRRLRDRFAVSHDTEGE